MSDIMVSGLAVTV